MTESGAIRFGDRRIDYRVVRSARRHKTIDVTIAGPGDVLVAAPVETSVDRIEATVRRRAAWIVRHDVKAPAPRPQRRFVSGESLPYLGRSVRLAVRASDIDVVAVRFQHWRFDVDVPAALDGEARRSEVRAAFESWYRRRAATKLAERVRRVAPLVGAKPSGIMIRDQRRRWGSCGPDGTLRFNWRLVMAKPALLDYVIAHELAHLKVRTHGAEYWALVAAAIPDYRARRAELGAVGATSSCDARCDRVPGFRRSGRRRRPAGLRR